MKRRTAVILLTIVLVCLIAPFAFAQEAAQAGTAAVSDLTKALGLIGAGFAIGAAALGTGIGQGLGLGKACEGVARNPAASGKITTTLIIGLAMIESLCIYALLVSLGIIINLKIFF